MKSVNDNGSIKWKVDHAEFKGYVRAKLENISEDIKNLHTIVKEQSNTCNIKHSDLNKRVGKLESFKSYILGIAAAVGAIAGIVASYLKNLWR